MIFLSILILIVAIALPSISQNIRSILYVRISSIIFIYAGALAFNAFYIQSIGSGIGIYSGLFQVTTINLIFDGILDQPIILSSFFIKNNNNKKILRSRILYNIKAGWNISVLPEHITRLDNNFYIRIFKIIGGISVFIIISGIGSNFNKIYFYIIFAISMLFIIYRIVIGFYALKQWIHNLRTGKFIVRNSPLDLVGSILRGGTASIRATAKFTVGTGMTYALCYELDEILKEDGMEPFFVPHMREIIRKTGVEGPAKTFMYKIGIKDAVVEPEVLDSHITTMSVEDQALFEESTGTKWSDYVKAHKTAVNIKMGIINASVSTHFDKDLIKKK
uniref:Uncharacterized protein n=1 Tax=Ganoderma calidophilum TaxID=2026244 RepID=A0A2S1WBR9_9APHY|nr:hypothetical protein [Ganoderma calidophilum]AWJ64025.1 hypothetical protein [Ganoderma calidophilum]